MVGLAWAHFWERQVSRPPSRLPQPLVCKVKVFGFTGAPRAVRAQRLCRCAVPREDASKRAFGGVTAHSSCARASRKRRSSPSLRPSALCRLSYTQRLLCSVSNTRTLSGPVCDPQTPILLPCLLLSFYYSSRAPFKMELFRIRNII